MSSVTSSDCVVAYNAIRNTEIPILTPKELVGCWLENYPQNDLNSIQKAGALMCSIGRRKLFGSAYKLYLKVTGIVTATEFN